MQAAAAKPIAVASLMAMRSDMTQASPPKPSTNPAHWRGRMRSPSSGPTTAAVNSGCMPATSAATPWLTPPPSAVVAFSIETREVDWGIEIGFVLAWLVLVLSVAATNLYYMMLRRGQAARVSSLFYLTPPTAAVLGYLTYGEVFGWFGLAGFGIAVVGVALALRGGR